MRISRALFGALVPGQVAYGLAARERVRPAAVRAIVALATAASVVQGVEARGARRGGLAALAAGGIGFTAELVGVATGRPFGHYAYSEKLGPRVRGVPVLAAAAWMLMARPAWVTAGLIARRRARRVPLAAGALTAWDVFLDPRMARDGFWSWPGGGRYEGVPATNFLGWFVTALGVFSAIAAVDGDDDPVRDGAFALYVWTWIGEAFANAVLWRRPVTAAAGTVAMGAFVLPAAR